MDRDRSRARMLVLLVCGAVAAATAPGAHFGPRVLEKTHGRYQESVRLVDEEQLLRNLVHLRYNELPLELNVSSIAAQYELNGTAEARPFFIAPNPSNSNIIFKTFTSILPDLNVSGANRPTITLVPADNGETVRRFLTPDSHRRSGFPERNKLAHRGGASALGRAAQRRAQRRDRQRPVTRGDL